MERRIAAIMLADIAGYSRLTEANEIATLERQKTHLAEVIEPTLAEHNGDLVKSTGDGFLAVFPSVIEAVKAAISIQRTIERRDADVPQDRRLRYRLGINLGDVVFENGDVHGNGVNVAARLEAMADAGGICISGTAYDQVRSAVEVGYEALGDVSVKNITQPVRVYKLLMDPELAGTVIEAPKQKRSTMAIASGVLLVLLVFVGGIYWWQQPEELKFAGPCGQEIPDKPSIAVLAFDNLSENADLSYIGDGLSENIITHLALNPKLFVIARNSSFTYKNKATDVRTIADELGVRYVLEGSIQASGDRLRVIAQLIDAEDGTHVWTENYDADLTKLDLLDLQDDISRRIFVSMDAELVRGRGPDYELSNLAIMQEDIETMRLMVEALSAYQKFLPEDNTRAQELLQEAIARTPNYTGAMVLLGYAKSTFLHQSGDPESSLAEARSWAEKAIELDPQHPDGHLLLAWIDMKDAKYTSAISNTDTAMKLAAKSGIGASLAGRVYALSGKPEKSIEYYCLGMRTEPFYPTWVPFQMAIALVMLDRLDEANAVLDELLEVTDHPIYASINAAVLVLQGREAQAKAIVEDWQTKFPDMMTVTTAAMTFSDAKDAVFRDRMSDALRRAGLPD